MAPPQYLLLLHVLLYLFWIVIYHHLIRDMRQVLFFFTTGVIVKVCFRLVDLYLYHRRNTLFLAFGSVFEELFKLAPLLVLANLRDIGRRDFLVRSTLVSTGFSFLETEMHARSRFFWLQLPLFITMLDYIFILEILIDTFRFCLKL